MGNELTVGKENMLSVMSDKSLSELIKPLHHEIFLFDSYVAGTSHIKDETVFEEAKAGDRLVLQREPENKFDDKAILILDEQKRKLGYVPEKDNVVFTRLMDAGKYLYAKVDDIEKERSFWKIKIGIYLVDF